MKKFFYGFLIALLALLVFALPAGASSRLPQDAPTPAIDPFWANLLIGLGVAIVSTLAGTAAAGLVAWARLNWAKFKNQQPDLAYELEQIAVKAVQAAEQSGLGKVGAEKKAFALEVAEKWLELKGFKIDLHLVDAEIEAAVYRELNKDKAQPHAQAGFVVADSGK